MNKLRGILLILMSGLLQGCFAEYKADKPLAAKVVLDGARAIVVTPADGQDSRPKTYAGSGRQVAEALKVVLEERGAVVAPTGAAKRTLTITPKIDLWEDRLTEWSGKSDLLEISLRVSEGGRTIDERTVRAKSKWYTYGGDHPQQMLTDLFRKWADNVFEKKPKK